MTLSTTMWPAMSSFVIVQVASPARPTVMSSRVTLRPTDTHPITRRITSSRRLRQRPRISLQRRVESTWLVPRQIIRSGAISRQREVRHRLRATVVIHHDLAQMHLRRDVVIRDRAGRLTSKTDSDVNPSPCVPPTHTQSLAA